MRGGIGGIRGLQKKGTLVGIIVLMVFLLYHILNNLHQSPVDNTLDFEDEKPPNYDGKKNSKRWIVVTTINQVTGSLRKLSQLLGWQMVVVGDLKSPPDWTIDGVVYLNIEEQKQLNYAVTKLLPYHSYTRKMIGYLYAIQHGARLIYETDDDNTILDGLKGFTDLVDDHSGKIPYIKTNNATYNPYPHFGQPSLWPRGYPLDDIGLLQPHVFSLEPAEHVTVYQGLTNSDPDVDALFRLTRTNKHIRLNLTFDTAMPSVALPVGTFAPFNSQNTMYTYDSFWALFLPTTVSQRVTDIWRSYWAQRLMWLSNQHLAFCPPGGYQIRNKHSLHQDMEEESDLYSKAGALVKYLNKWKCEEMHFFGCVSKLTKDMSLQGFWKHEDTHVLDAWLADLSSLGYAPPAMIENVRKGSKYDKSTSPYIHLFATEQMTPMSHTPYAFSQGKNSLSRKAKQYMKHSCRKTRESKNKYLEEKTLVVISAKSTSLLPFYEIQYRLKFSNIIYCLSQSDLLYAKISFILLPKWSEVLCLKTALRLGYNVVNFMYVGPNVLLNLNSFASEMMNRAHLINFDDVIVPPERRNTVCKSAGRCKTYLVSEMKKQLVSLFDMLQDIPNSVLQCMKTALLPNEHLSDHVTHSLVNVFIIPKAHPTVLSLIEEGNSDVHNFHVIQSVIPVVFKCMHEKFSFLSMSSMGRFQSENVIFPFDYTKLLKNDQSSLKLFCDILLM